jgi:HlyD family secretion protein
MPFAMPSRRTSILAGGALALAAIVGGVGIAAVRNMTPQADIATAVRAQTLTQVAALGRIEPRGEVIHVASGIPDRLESMLVQRGEIVSKGQILAYLQSHALEVAQRSQIAAQLAAAELKLKTEITVSRARLESAQLKLKAVNDVSPIRIAAQEATIRGNEAELRNSRKILEANTRLMNRQAGSERNYDNQSALVIQQEAILLAANARLAELKQQYEADRADAEIQIQLAEASAARAMAELEITPLARQLALQDERVRRTTIYAPSNGQILEIFTWPGEIVGSTPILTMGDTEKMRVVAEIYETDISRVKIGQRARITSRALTGSVTGRVVEIGWTIHKNDVLNVDPAARADARVVEVRIELDDAEPVKRLTNHTVDVLIDAAEPRNAQVSGGTAGK